MNTQNTELHRIARTLTPSRFPKKFAIELCADCNLNCVMCHHDQMERPKGVMPFALFTRLADQLAENCPDCELWVSFCGEPLLEPALLVDVLQHAKDAGLTSVNLNTNGMLLTPEWAAPILATGVNKVVFGVDGFEADTYEKIRVGGKRETLYENIQALLDERERSELSTQILVQWIFMEENEGEFEAFRDHWHAKGATVKARRMLSWGGRFDACNPEEKLERIPCPWAVTMMHVFWDGRVPRCPGDTEGDEGAIGNAWQRTVEDLWGELHKYRAMHLEHRFDELPDRCQTCTDWMTGAAERIRPRAV